MSLPYSRSITGEVVVPFTVIVDSREQHPFRFMGYTADARYCKKSEPSPPLVIPVKIAGLKSGDYSLEGYEDQIAIERKSLEDLYGSFGDGRDRFEREIVRLNEMNWAAVVIEAGWGDIISHPPRHTEMLPKVIYRSILSWSQKYPHVHWLPLVTRGFAERTTFRMLEMFWKIEQEK